MGRCRGDGVNTNGPHKAVYNDKRNGIAYKGGGDQAEENQHDPPHHEVGPNVPVLESGTLAGTNCPSYVFEYTVFPHQV